jgi:ribosome-associated protein
MTESSKAGQADDRGTDGLLVNGGVRIPRVELTIRASRSGGPGGQHVNTSSTRVEVVWNVRESAALTEDERKRLLATLASKLDSDGALRVVASDTRSQKRNRELAEARLAETVRVSLVVPKKRKRTRVPRGAVERRLAEKKRRSGRKQDRKIRGDD